MSVSAQKVPGTGQSELAAGRSAASRYGFAAACLVLAVLARTALDPDLSEQHPYATFFVAVVAVSWVAGLVPAILTSILGYFAAELFFAGPRHVVLPNSVGDAVGQATYFMVTLAIILFGHSMQRARLQALSRQTELEREITERKRAEAALRDSESRERARATELEALMDAAPAAILIAHDAECGYMSGNRRSYGLLRAPTDSRVMLEGVEIAPQELPVQRAASTGQPVRNSELELAFEEGASVYLLGDAVPMLDENGRPRGAVGVFVDITKRKRAEQALRQSREDLNRAQAVAHTGSWRLDVRRNELLWSSENHRIFGIPEDRPLTYETFLGVVHPDDRDFVDRSWQAGLHGAPYDIEHRIVVDGAVRWVRERAELEFDQQGVVLGGFGTTQDVTERKLIEEERAQRARLKDEFLALLGHELRNPLAAISTAVHLIRGGVNAERRAPLDQMMGRQVAVLQRLVDDLLDLTRISHGQIELRQKCIDLGQFLQEAAAAARSYVAGSGQELVLRLPAGRILFMADAVRLEQIVANLLSNASKYTGRGGIIELSGAQEASEVVLRCKDNGRGIPWGMQEVIFEPFTRAEKAGQSTEAGVGIGLALVRRLVELHGGTVSAESGGPGAGSEFVVRLPLVEPPPDLPTVRAAPRAPQARRSLSVVVVEDNPDVAQTLAIALEQAGHKATLFTDGPSALAGVASSKPAAVILDIGLPRMDGYELAARLRTEPALKHTVLIALSGFKRREEAGKPRGDFDHYFVKPIDPAKLLALLEAHARAAKAG